MNDNDGKNSYPNLLIPPTTSTVGDALSCLYTATTEGQGLGRDAASEPSAVHPDVAADSCDGTGIEAQRFDRSTIHIPEAVPSLTNERLEQALISGTPLESRMTNEAAAALEFLAHGRRSVLDKFTGRDSITHPTPSIVVGGVEPHEQWDPFIPIEDARMLLALHQSYLSWMHNAVHMPTFRREFEENLLRRECDKSWVALYYALLSVSFVLTSP
jgi:hypothetical protein